jgi:hypothetical protein
MQSQGTMNKLDPCVLVVMDVIVQWQLHITELNHVYTKVRHAARRQNCQALTSPPTRLCADLH